MTKLQGHVIKLIVLKLHSPFGETKGIQWFDCPDINSKFVYGHIRLARRLIQQRPPKNITPLQKLPIWGCAKI